MRKIWQATSYLVIGGATGAVALAHLVMLVLAIVTAPLGIGIPLLSSMLGAQHGFLTQERARIGRFLGAAIGEPRRASDPAGGRRLLPQLRQATTYRESLWLLLHSAVGMPVAFGVGLLYFVAVGSWLVTVGWWVLPPGTFSFFVPITTWEQALTIPPLFAVPATAAIIWLVPAIAWAHSRLGRSLLRPTSTDRLSERVEELSHTRAEALDAHAAELRRIERDLHDGIQARLVAIGIHLGVSQRQRGDTPESADQLVDRARTGVEETLTELQAVVRGIYPPILSDRGLDGALHALAADSPVPMELTLDPPGRLPAAVEAAAYHVAAEAVTNVAKHSRATAATLRVTREANTLIIEVTDDGRGGADESGGTGIAGMRRRAAALDGRMRLASPVGGPTQLRVELPCES
ncbi:sensor histidine kinase [Stackebrandtia nassauensis]|uniref:histidine kinase n=1 Tax=Stackebrandtia nassauensis (strain DSM 44728 / CIP 108903 / NRRL B-16338 / NBRC 102104 / LLR-40K-21) TaxID=446470 RepID=D3Q7M6_STANL|nr:sensor histidine kinase [Stackebrandtia nassauensis]ADD44368.1 histidine kinase [Stackebrandtia nassauensis DSM 44728]